MHRLKAPRIYQLEHLQGIFTGEPTLAEIDGVWVPARPMGFDSLSNRILFAWWVFIGKADILVWPGNQ